MSAERVAALALLASLAACARSPVPPAQGGARRPDGAVADLAFHAPAPALRASAGDMLVALRTPLDPARALDLVQAWFDAIGREDDGAIASLALPSAMVVPRVRGPGVAFGDHWRVRLRRVRYRGIVAEPPWRPGDVELATAEELDRRGVPRPADAAAGDLRVHVPIVPGRGGERLFGDAVDLWLRPDGSRWRIRMQVEDFQLP